MLCLLSLAYARIVSRPFLEQQQQQHSIIVGRHDIRTVQPIQSSLRHVGRVSRGRPTRCGASTLGPRHRMARAAVEPFFQPRG